MKIFLSSTFTDLKRHRAAAIQALDRIGQTIAMEKFVASNDVPLDECLSQVREADTLVLLIGGRYGSIDEKTGLSITELEYRTAKELGLAVLAFVKISADGRWHSTETDPDILAKQAAFKRRVENETTRASFSGPADLKYELTLSLSQHFSKYGGVGTRGAAFQTPAQFFGNYVDDTKLFNHTFPLVGRTTYIKQLQDVAVSETRVVILSGHGGMGKSKILQAASAAMATTHPDVTVCFLGEGNSFGRDDIKELPAGRIVIIVDDAHRVHGLPELFAFARQHRERISLVLATRPYGLSRLEQQLLEAGYDGEDVLKLPELKELSADEALALAREVVHTHDERLLARLVDLSKESPLITVIAGQLIVRRGLDPSLLPTDDAAKFRDAVLQRFQDVVFGDVANAFGRDPELVKRTLQLVSALAPINPERAELIERSATFLKLQPFELLSVLDELELSGVLVRRADSLAISPDILSDSILHNACFMASGQLTGYSDQIVNEFRDLALENVMRNMAELDWQISRGDSTGLLRKTWQDLENRFGVATLEERLSLLGLIAKVAYFQPGDAIAFVRLALTDPAPAAPAPETYPFLEDSLVHALPPILHAAAHYEQHIRTAAELLWEIGRDDDRPLNSYPDHPIRVLTELASYERRGKDLGYNAIMQQWLEDVARGDDAFQHRHSPFVVVRALLAREGEESWSQGRGFNIARFSINPQTTAALRNRALDLVQKVALRGDHAVRRQAVKLLVDVVFRSMIGLGNYVPSEEDFAAWQDEDRHILGLLEQLLASEENPMLIVEAEDDLLAMRLDPRRRAIVEDIDRLLSQLPKSLDATLVRYIRQGRIQRRFIRRGPTGPIDYAALDAEVSRELDQAIEDLCARSPEPDELKRDLEKLVRYVRDAGIEARDDFFFEELGRRQPERMSRVCDLVLADPESPLVEYLQTLLRQVREHDPARFRAYLEEAEASGDLRLLRSAAWALRTLPALEEAEDRKMGRRFALHPDRSVAMAGVGALQRSPEDARAELWDVLGQIRIDEDGAVADWLCMLFEGPNSVPLAQVPAPLLASLLDRFVTIADLTPHYSVLDLLEQVASKDLGQFTTYFLDRVEYWKTLPDEKRGAYRPIPFSWGTQRAASSTQGEIAANAEVALCTIRDRMLAANSAERQWLKLLFSRLANQHPDAALTALDEWLVNADAQRVLMVAHLLEGMGPNFVFDQQPFVIQLLQVAEELGGELPDLVRSSLRTSALSSSRSGVVGEPPTETVNTRDRALATSEAYSPGSAAYRFYRELYEAASDRIDLIVMERDLSDGWAE